MLGFGYCLMVSWLFCFLCFTSSVSLTAFYTEDEPLIVAFYFALSHRNVFLTAVGTSPTIRDRQYQAPTYHIKPRPRIGSSDHGKITQGKKNNNNNNLNLKNFNFQSTILTHISNRPTVTGTIVEKIICLTNNCFCKFFYELNLYMNVNKTKGA